MSENESKKDRRNAARERARIQREKEQARRRRNKTLGISGIIVGSLAVVAVIVLVIANSVQPAGPGPKNMASDGIVFQGVDGKIEPVSTKAIPSGGDATPTKQSDDSIAHITVYEDYLCPYCNQFETANMDQIKEMVKTGDATLELHPFNLLDRSSLGAKYSTRSANAAACVANYEPDKFLDVNSIFYKNQPSEGTRGLSNDQLVQYVQEAGAKDKSIPSCIKDGEFSGWVADATNRALNDKIPNSDLDKLTGTPLVLVNGKQWAAAGSNQSLTDAQGFAAFVEQAVSKK